MTFLMIFGFVAVAILVYAVIQSRASIHQYYVIPAALASVIGITFFYNTVLGYPTTNLSETRDFSYIAHATDGETIWIWVQHEGDDEPRSYAKPYDEGSHAKLEAAGEKIKNGIMVKGSFNEENEGDKDSKQAKFQYGLGEDSLGGQLELYDIDPAKYLPEKTASPKASYVPLTSSGTPYVTDSTQEAMTSPPPVWDRDERVRAQAKSGSRSTSEPSQHPVINQNYGN